MFERYFTPVSEYCKSRPSSDNALFCSVLNLTITYSPISLFKWQMYAAQGMRNKWYGMLGADFVEESDEDQDSLKVEILCLQVCLLICIEE